jgi:hypothetical protein
MAETSPTGQQPPAASGAPSEAPSVWNVPNALTTLRIVMVPFFGWALLTDGGDSVLWRLVAWAIFAVAMITDKIDGDLARKHGLVTDFGKIADPIADKAITGMAFIGLSLVGDLWWWVTVLVLLRYRTETGVDGLDGTEHPYLACSFWMVTAYALAGRHDDAHALMRRLLELPNDVGLLSEEYDPVHQHFVGNFPQAFSHLTLVGAAVALEQAQASGDTSRSVSSSDPSGAGH